MFNSSKIKKLEDNVNELENEVGGYEMLFNTIFENFDAIISTQNRDRELILDLVFALAMASGVKPPTLSRHIDQDRLSKYVGTFNDIRDKERVKKMEKMVENVKKNLDKKKK